MDQEADGAPRFNAPQSFTTYALTGFINSSDSNSLFDAILTLMYQEWTYVYAGASALPAVAAAIGVSASLLAF